MKYLFTLFAVSFFVSAFSQPANDNPCGAITLSIVSNADSCNPVPFNYTTPATYVNLALPALPPGGCGFNWSNASSSADVWYLFQSSSPEAWLKFIALRANGVTYFQTDFILYRASNCNGPFTFITCGSQDNGDASIALTGLNPDSTYYLRVFVEPQHVGIHNVCLYSGLPPASAMVGINTVFPQKNLDVAGDVQFRNKVNFKKNVDVSGNITSTGSVSAGGKGSFTSLDLNSQLGSRIGLFGSMTNNHLVWGYNPAFFSYIPAQAQKISPLDTAVV